MVVLGGHNDGRYDQMVVLVGGVRRHCVALARFEIKAQHLKFRRIVRISGCRRCGCADQGTCSSRAFQPAQRYTASRRSVVAPWRSFWNSDGWVNTNIFISRQFSYFFLSVLQTSCFSST